MCGIVGVVSPLARVHEALPTALRRLHHRGPDDEGTYRADGVSLGMRRLSIIDLAGGHQPIANEDGSVQVVLNGEIYNYRELAAELRAAGHAFRTSSDTEVLVHLYEEHGEELVQKLRGMFAFALYDTRARKLLLGRDRFGKKPLYYAQHPDAGLVFASEIKALHPLLKAAGSEPAVDPQAIYDYLSLGTVPQPATAFEGIRCVPAAHTATWADGRLALRPYWGRDTFEVDPRLSYEEAMDRTRHLIRESVELRLRSDVPVGLFLSGGLDSSVVAYEAAQRGHKVRTFTVAMPDRTLNEADTAGRTAAALGLPNTVLHAPVDPRREIEFIARHYDQPFADSSAIASLAVARAAREHVTVVLNGDGGDELFAGYRRYVAARFLDHLPGSARRAAGVLAPWARRWSGARRSTLGFTARLLRGLTVPDGERYLVWTTDMLFDSDKRSAWRGPPDVRATEDTIQASVAPAASQLRWQLSADVRFNFASDLLVKMDIATMAASVEARSPLMDHVLAEFVATVPDRFLLRRGVPKALLRDAYATRLPQEVTRGAKRGFEVPLRSWLGNELKPCLHDLLGDPNARIGSFVDPSLVRRSLARDWPDRNGDLVLYALLMLELWLRDLPQARSAE